MDAQYQCTRCKAKMPFSQVRYDRNQKLVCYTCLGILEKEQQAKDRMSAQDFAKVNFICMKCRFKFSFTKGSHRKLACPYCQGTQLMQVKKYKDENDLISESMDERFDY
jgi:DNA-directed RNA polymerase subunit RPC12/RpoP